ncbi:MAG: hypothetical protein P4L84_20480, partial [Isosphaeraceae bacterium]|nr:hypothetical protein [Isosphaeraceae bacterium]
MSANASPRAVAYIVDRFPSCSETFIVREIVALGRNHVSVHVFALRRGEDEVVHEDSARLLPSVIFAPAPWGLRAAVALGYFLVCNPRRLLWCLLPALLA